VAPGAGVVVVESTDRVEPEHSTDFGDLSIDPSAETCFQRAGDSSGEAERREIRSKLVVQSDRRDGA
jgi:hypothetical protein